MRIPQGGPGGLAGAYVALGRGLELRSPYAAWEGHTAYVWGLNACTPREGLGMGTHVAERKGVAGGYSWASCVHRV